MNKTLALILTHALVLAAGYGVHRTIAGPPSSGEIPARRERPAPAAVERRPVSPAAGKTGARSSSDLRKAWHAMKRSPVSLEELRLLRERIFREWAAKDLRSALIAWAEDGEFRDGFHTPLMPHEVFEGREEEIFGWIMAGDFGLDSPVLLDSLTNWLRGRNLPLLLKLIPEVPEELHERLMRRMFAVPYDIDASGHERVDENAMHRRIEGIADLPDERLRSLAWRAMLDDLIRRGDNGFHAMLEREDLPADARNAALGSFAKYLAGTQKPADSMERFRKLSPEDQAEIGPELLEQARQLSFAHHSAVTSALTMLAESGQWDLIASRGPAALDSHFEYAPPNAEAVSRWALDLPAREETAETFRHAVSPRFREDLAGGMEWALGLPDGWHRDQAMAALAVAAGARQDTARRDQALDEIADPRLREEAGGR